MNPHRITDNGFEPLEPEFKAELEQIMHPVKTTPLKDIDLPGFAASLQSQAAQIGSDVNALRTLNHGHSNGDLLRIVDCVDKLVSLSIRLGWIVGELAKERSC